MSSHDHPFDPRLDLRLERIVDVPREVIWRAWTEPERLKRWFTPAPWTTSHCEIDLRPGGTFHKVMRSPEGQELDLPGCYLEVVPNEKLVWTNVLGPGYRPISRPARGAEDELWFSAVITMVPHGSGTRYTVRVIHGKEEIRKRHEEMGFEHGWGTAFEQLVAEAKRSWMHG